MTRVEELQSQIESLPDEDFRVLHKWMSERDWDKWDKQIEADSASGKLDFLIAEASDALRKGNARPL